MTKSAVKITWNAVSYRSVKQELHAAKLTKTPMAMPIQGTVGNVHHAYMNIPAGNNTAAKHALYRRASGPLVL